MTVLRGNYYLWPVFSLSLSMFMTLKPRAVHFIISQNMQVNNACLNEEMETLCDLSSYLLQTINPFPFCWQQQIYVIGTHIWIQIGRDIFAVETHISAPNPLCTDQSHVTWRLARCQGPQQGGGRCDVTDEPQRACVLFLCWWLRRREIHPGPLPRRRHDLEIPFFGPWLLTFPPAFPPRSIPQTLLSFVMIIAEFSVVICRV